MAPAGMAATALLGGKEGDAAYERVLLPSLDYLITRSAVSSTFTWVLKPAEGLLQGTIYTDGSSVWVRRPL